MSGVVVQDVRGALSSSSTSGGPADGSVTMAMTTTTAADSNQISLEYESDEFQNAKLVIRNSAFKSTTTTDDDGGAGTDSDEYNKGEEEANLSDEVIESECFGDEMTAVDQQQQAPIDQEAPAREQTIEKSLSEPMIQSPDHSNYQLDKPAKLAFETDFLPKGITCGPKFGSLHIYTKPPSYESSSNNSIFHGIFGCIKPILSLWVSKADKAAHRDSTHGGGGSMNNNDDFNIPFESITNLEWINSGSQGCVFKGLYKNEPVAIKKVKSKEETNIRHFKKLDHPNLVKLIGISVNSIKFFCIVMEFCPHGQLYTYLNNLKPKAKCISATLFIDWSRQIAGGMQYLHSNKIIHRDLKSPNILISDNNMLKISDFGASRKISEEKSTVMSFKGTVAWMAPEVIRNEACSEKVDVYSYGVVLWEMLTCEIPFKNLDQNSIMWGVGSNRLRLEIPERAPTGVKLLLQQCLNIKPRNRPSFNQIIKHLEIIEKLEIREENMESFFAECNQELRGMRMGKDHQHDENATKFYTNNADDELVKQRHEELRHAAEIRELYEKKLEKANNLYFELSTVLLQLEEREREIIKREQSLNIHKKKIVRPLIKKEFQDKKSSTGQLRLMNPNYLPASSPANASVNPLTAHKNQKSRSKPALTSNSKKFNKSNQAELSQDIKTTQTTTVTEVSNAVTLRDLKSFSVSDLRLEDATAARKTPTTGLFKKATAATTRENLMKNLRPNSLLKIKVYSNIISQAALNLNDAFLQSKTPPSTTAQQPQPAKHHAPVNSNNNHIVISNQNSNPPPPSSDADTGINVNAMTTVTAAINPPVNVGHEESRFKKRRTSL